MRVTLRCKVRDSGIANSAHLTGGFLNLERVVGSHQASGFPAPGESDSSFVTLTL